MHNQFDFLFFPTTTEEDSWIQEFNPNDSYFESGTMANGYSPDNDSG